MIWKPGKGKDGRHFLDVLRHWNSGSDVVLVTVANSVVFVDVAELGEGSHGDERQPTYKSSTAT